MKNLTSAVTLLLTIAFAVSPALTNPFSGFLANQLPIPQTDPPIQPAGYAFSIWGLIYAWLIVSAVYGFLKRPNDQDWNAARKPLIVSLAVGVPWLAIANASAIWATITIIIMAVGAVWSLIISPTRDRWWFQAPVGIYAGWLTAASCVSLGTTMAGYGVLANSFGWAFIGIIIGLLVTTTVFMVGRKALEYLMTVVWALSGIIVANGTEILPVSILAGIGAIFLSFLAIRLARPTFH